jgi:hypothetical protein
MAEKHAGDELDDAAPLLPPRPERVVYTIAELAAMLGCGINQTYSAAKAGQFPVVRIGKRIVAPKALIDRMLGIGGDAA